MRVAFQVMSQAFQPNPSLTAIPAIHPTADGSNTVANADGIRYHSENGAFTESLHVFITNGLNTKVGAHLPVRILEVGTGTGLNALLAFAWARIMQTHVLYVGLEPFPLPKTTLQELQYLELLNLNGYSIDAEMLHEDITTLCETAPWQRNKAHAWAEYHLLHTYFADFESQKGFDIIFYDAFSSDYAPDMWTVERITQAASLLNPGGIFVTYACTGDLKRMLRANGLKVECLPGAPGKRHMTRATKPF